MGCDIHVIIEKREGDTWARVPWTDPYRMKHAQSYPESNRADALQMPEEFDNRNYDLFGVLANVRNGTWGEEISPIAEPRGIPDDMSKPRPTDEDYWLGDHSFSYVTLRELEAYDWNAPTKKRGWVNHEQALAFQRTHEPPTSYAAGGNHGEYIDWTQTRRIAVRGWPDKVLPILRTLGGPDDVRLVFGFDN